MLPCKDRSAHYTYMRRKLYHIMLHFPHIFIKNTASHTQKPLSTTQKSLNNYTSCYQNNGSKQYYGSCTTPQLDQPIMNIVDNTGEHHYNSNSMEK